VVCQDQDLSPTAILALTVVVRREQDREVLCAFERRGAIFLALAAVA
jgi:hypothetical protein